MLNKKASVSWSSNVEIDNKGKQINKGLSSVLSKFMSTVEFP